ncbi:uncharacterized protein At2g34160-like [Nicotiana tabacum]|uniref:Uncharacterized protein At2g34160-like n=1 Tax=Nicotiana tabacum TaxID=4097 RepID=A0A1S3Z759_TOBAC|nr:uncharacterized protein At2g34160 [Nicotiana tomentosiformis]XP_016460226.1 PREDICTED: uncharacterized protein At2g34160-like [Nicotiana tabacum]
MTIETMAPTAAPTPTPAQAPAPAQAQPQAQAANNNEAPKKSNRIQVSNTKKPLFFYVNLAKRYMQQHTEVELSALGMAITTVVTVAEILKNGGFATEKKVLTSTVGMKDEAKGRMVQKARIEIVLTKSEKFDKLMTPNNNGERAVAQNSAATKNNNDNKEQIKK